MSLEAAIAELTKAVQEQTDLIKKGIGAAKTKAQSGGDVEEKPKSKPRGRKPKAPTEEDLREKFGGYMESGANKAEKQRLTNTVKAILEHFGVARVTEIDKDDWPEAMGYCDKLIAGFEEGGVDGAEEVDLELSNEGEEEEDDEVL